MHYCLSCLLVVVVVVCLTLILVSEKLGVLQIEGYIDVCTVVCMCPTLSCVGF